MRSPRLPHHRRQNWRIIARNNTRALWMLAVSFIISLLLFAAYEYLQEYDLRLARENEIRDLIRQHYELTTMGAPGYTRTDYVEKTNEMEK